MTEHELNNLTTLAQDVADFLKAELNDAKSARIKGKDLIDLKDTILACCWTRRENGPSGKIAKSTYFNEVTTRFRAAGLLRDGKPDRELLAKNRERLERFLTERLAGAQVAPPRGSSTAT